MKLKSFLLATSAHFFMWLVLLLAGLGVLVIVPTISQSLSNQFSEFANDELLLRGMMSAPVVVFSGVIAIVLVLVSRIRKDRMFSSEAAKWVRLLIGTTAALGLVLVGDVIWLGGKNALPPFAFFTLAFLASVTFAASFVTAHLLGLLKKATSLSEDLSGVI